MVDTIPLPASSPSIPSFGPLTSQRHSCVHLAIVGLATSLALLAGAFLQYDVHTYINGYPPGDHPYQTGFEIACLILLLDLNPQMLAFLVLSAILPSSWLQHSVGSALFLALIPAWWGLFAFLSLPLSPRTSQ